MGPPCPTGGEDHGGLLDIPMPDGGTTWHCPHASHQGVAYTIDGERQQGMSRHIFTDKEATEAQEAYWKGTA